MGLNVEHRQHKGLNNRTKNAHLPTLRREKIIKRFTSARHLKRPSLSTMGSPTSTTVPAPPCRHLTIERFVPGRWSPGAGSPNRASPRSARGQRPDMAFALIIHALASCCLYANRFGHHDADSLIRISAVKQGHASAKIDPDNATAFTVLSEAQLQNVKLVIIDELGYVPLSQIGAQLLLVQIIQIFQEQYPGGLLDVIEFGRATVLLTEGIVDVPEDLFKHDAPDFPVGWNVSRSAAGFKCGIVTGSPVDR